MAGLVQRLRLGNRVAPVRFLLFLLLLAAGSPAGVALTGWRAGVMLGFDIAAAVFLLACLPLLGFKPQGMREAVKRNDANRAALLAITAIVMLVVLVAVASELSQKGAPNAPVVALVVGTLVLAWFFSNTVYALHYAHLYYIEEDGEDHGGLDFPKTPEPDYWDFVYFAFCLGMTFQTSDVEMTDQRFRMVSTFHCLAAFVFNLGVLAFTINVLGGG